MYNRLKLIDDERCPDKLPVNCKSKNMAVELYVELDDAEQGNVVAKVPSSPKLPVNIFPLVSRFCKLYTDISSASLEGRSSV